MEGLSTKYLTDFKIVKVVKKEEYEKVVELRGI
jgi:hypothetical protein